MRVCLCSFLTIALFPFETFHLVHLNSVKNFELVVALSTFPTRHP